MAPGAECGECGLVFIVRVLSKLAAAALARCGERASLHFPAAVARPAVGGSLAPVNTPLRRSLALISPLAALAVLAVWLARLEPARLAEKPVPPPTNVTTRGRSGTIRAAAPAVPVRRETVSAKPLPLPPDADAIARFDEWSARYLAASTTEKGALVPEGLRLAETRRAELKALIPADPKRALDSAVPMVVRQALPAAIVARLEERINANAFYGVLGVTPDPDAPAIDEPPIRREVRLDNGTRYEAHVYGKRATQPTTEHADVNGIAIDKVLALDERRLRVLEAGERPDPGKPIFNVCPISGKTVAVEPAKDGAPPPIDADTPAIEVGGEIHYLCDGGHIHAVEEGLVAAEGGSGGPVKPTGTIPTTQSTGVRTVLYMRVTFPETNLDPQSEAEVYDLMRQVNDFMVESSYGSLYLLTTVTPLLVMPHSKAWYVSGGGSEYDVRTDAQAAALALGYDWNQYDHDVTSYTGGPGTFGGLGYVGSKGIWLRSHSVGVAAHEFGHNFGLWHANFWNTNDQTSIGSGANLEYGNSFDTMGPANGGDYHFNAAHKTRLNWLAQQTFVTQVTQSGTYRIFAFDQPRLDPANRYSMRIRKDSQREYYTEFRQKSFSGNKWVRDGILLNWAPWSGGNGSNGGSQLIDTTPGTPGGRSDAAITIGRTFSDFESGIHITPIGKGGTVPESMDVVVNVGTFPGNRPPTLTVSASAPNVPSNTPINFTANASDPDGDALSYAWDFGDSTFSNTNSPSVSKTWSSGDYVVRCVVSDMKGQTTSDSVAVHVGNNTNFRVSGKVTLDGQPLANVIVSTNTGSGSAITDSDGTYTLGGLYAQDISLTAALGGYTFTPTFTNPFHTEPTVTNADFVATQTPVVTLTVTDADCSEAGGNTGTFHLARTGSTAAALTVNFLTSSGTAAKGADYSLTPSVSYFVIMAAGQASVDVVLTPVNDSTGEGPETATLEMAPGSGYEIAGSASASIVIQDNDTSLPVVSLRVTDDEARETGDTAAFLVSRTGPTTNALVVKLSTGGQATPGSDYVSIGTQVTIPAGAVSAPIVITPLDDNLAEGTETVQVDLVANAAYILTPDNAGLEGTINLVDDDIATVTVTAGDNIAYESASDPATFVITRTGSTAQPLTVDYALGGSAAHGVDYAALPGVLTIPAGSTVASVTVVPKNDALGEPQQTVSLQLRGRATYVVGEPGNATVTITDSSDRPVVAIGVSAGDAGEPASTGNFKFTTTGTGFGNITIHYTVTGTATPGVDYVALPGTLTMGRNTTTQLTVTPIDDNVPEGFETVVVTIDSNSAYTTFLDTSATMNLVDDDQPVVSISTTNSSFSEAGSQAKFWFSRTGYTTDALTVNYTIGGTATNGADYVSLPGTITIPAGAGGVALRVVPIEDTLKEGTETLVLTIAPGAYGVGLGSATDYLADNDSPAVQVRFPTPTGSGSESAGMVNVPVVLSGISAVPVTVEYAIGGGTATGGIDYSLTPGVLTFAPGEYSKTIPLTILEDDTVEPTETVIVRLQNANGSGLGPNTYTFTINDDDAPPAPTVDFAATGASGLESVSPAQIVVSLSAAQSGSVSVDYAITTETGATATSGADFTLATGTLVFAPGETAKIVPNTIVNDTTLEPNETLALTLSNAVGAGLGANTLFTYTIIDDDAATLTITATDPTASESGYAGSFTLTRIGALTSALTANLTISGTATNGADYTSIPATVVFAANSATAAITIAPIADSFPEADETVIVTLANGAGYTVGIPASATVTILDNNESNAAPTLTLQRPASNDIAIPSGVGLILKATAGDDGHPLVPGALTVAWTRVSGPGAVTFGNADAANTTANFSADGAYLLRLTASDGALETSLDVAVNVGASVQPWTSQDIGGATPAGSDSESSGTFTVSGGGTNISGTSDQFHLVSQTLTGDGTITARVVSMTGSGNSAKAGVMLRNTTAANSRAAFTSSYLPTSPYGANTFRTRATDGASFNTTTKSGTASYPLWVRVVRSGDSFSGFTSPDGQTWTQVGPTQTIPMNAPLLAGLAVTSNTTSALCTAVFDNVTITNGPPNLGPFVDAGADVAVSFPAPATLAGSISDDGKPLPANLTSIWQTISGPGEVGFANPNAASTTATFTVPGAYVLRLVADDGEVATFDDLQVTTDAPTVTIVATDDTATEVGPTTGALTISRTGDTTAALVVHFTEGGTAEVDDDYISFGTEVTIPSGAASAEVIVTPLADATAEGDETVQLILIADSAYVIGGTGNATVTIADEPMDAWRFTHFGASANDPLIAGDLANPDGDGLVNLLERALASDPLTNDASALPVFALEGTDATLTYRRPTFAADLTYAVEKWSAPDGWNAAPFTEEIVTDHGATRTVKDRIPLDGAKQMMLRLKVTRTP